MLIAYEVGCQFGSVFSLKVFQTAIEITHAIQPNNLGILVG